MEGRLHLAGSLLGQLRQSDLVTYPKGIAAPHIPASEHVPFEIISLTNAIRENAGYFTPLNLSCDPRQFQHPLMAHRPRALRRDNPSGLGNEHPSLPKARRTRQRGPTQVVPSMLGTDCA